MMRRSVDLPEPLGPRSAVSEPLSTSSETSSTATKSPNFFETLRIRMDIGDFFGKSGTAWPRENRAALGHREPRYQ